MKCPETEKASKIRTSNAPRLYNVTRLLMNGEKVEGALIDWFKEVFPYPGKSRRPKVSKTSYENNID
jgi:hypothetical protein